MNNKDTMRYVVFDLETQNIFSEVEDNNPTSLDISVASFYDSQEDKYTTVSIDKLHKIWSIVEQSDALVGYNSNYFDIPLLNKYYPGDLTQIKSIDILEKIKMSLGRRVRLDSVAKATLGIGKISDGLQAVRWWREGKVDEIKKYCQKDVEVTKDIFLYALKHNKLYFQDGGQKRQIDIDTSAWQEKQDVSLTKSLPF